MTDVHDDRRETEEASEENCQNCGEWMPDCQCCQSCGGQGSIEDGGCGGGCEFCRPFPKCLACDGTGKVRE